MADDHGAGSSGDEPDKAKESTQLFPSSSYNHSTEAATQGTDTSPSCASISEAAALEVVPSKGQKAWDLCRGVLLDARTERAARLTAPLIFWYCVAFIPKLADGGPGVL